MKRIVCEALHSLRLCVEVKVHLIAEAQRTQSEPVEWNAMPSRFPFGSIRSILVTLGHTMGCPGLR